MKFFNSNFRVSPGGRSQVLRRHRAPAFTLIEMMITVGLLGFIVLGLTAMFVHTQKAFRAGVTQTDVLESGRAAMELLTRELEGMTPSRIPNVTNFYSRFEAHSANNLIAPSQPRVNILSCFFFLSEYNQKWTGIGYLVAVPTNKVNEVKVGTLYRFQLPSGSGGGTNASLNTLSNFGAIFRLRALAAINNGNLPVNTFHANSTNISTDLTRVCDGVVGLRVLGYDENGVLISPTNTVKNTLSITNFSGRIGGDFPVPMSGQSPLLYLNGMIEYTCTNNAVPAYVDLELDILESQAWERFKAIPSTAARDAYLQRQAGTIHVFRRRVAIHNVDLEAYQ